MGFVQDVWIVIVIVQCRCDFVNVDCGFYFVILWLYMILQRRKCRDIRNKKRVFYFYMRFD